ncbi:unnamed protein product [Bemisia tabaci]|uniref:Integrase catalytic domain-containing protein n=1 Tax=Bemisia tabaci TaxID=7038 RepID=A0AAI8UV27_BEMTA|nr:unnamed protein product [Bemisia tabaci]
MEYFGVILRDFSSAENCIRQGNADHLAVLAPNLAENYAALNHVRNVLNGNNGVQQILTSVLDLLRDQLFQCNRLLQVSTVANTNEPLLPVIRGGHVGQPRLDIPVDEVITLRRCNLSWSKIARVLNVSRQSLWNFRRRSNLEDPHAFSNLDDEELANEIFAIYTQHPSIGYKYLWASLKTRGIFVTWARLISCVRLINPIGVLSRRRRRLRRREYRVKASNYLWHMDGNEKLVPWHFYIHGCTDGFSRKIIYLQLSVTKGSDTVLEIFERGVEKHGLPMRVRGDRGTENVRVMDFMQTRRCNIEAPYIQGRSVHNTRIERLWAEVNSVVSSKFRRIFRHLEHADVLSQLSVLDLLCLIYVYFPRIQKSLDSFRNLWNNHGLRTAHNATPNELWLLSLRQLSSEEDVFELELVPEFLDLDFTASSDVELPLPNIDVSVFQLSPEELDHFGEVAHTLVPNPLLDDSQEGVSLYMTLRNHLLNDRFLIDASE